MSDSAVPWTIRPYRAGDEHGILELFNGVFEVGNPDFVPRSLEQWRWQFADAPQGHQTYVGEVDGRIVGQYTGIPQRWRLKEGVQLGTQALDTCVSVEFRRSLKKSGLFLSLCDVWFGEFGRPDRSQIVYGFPNPQAFRIGTRKVGYVPVRCPLPMFALDLGSVPEAPAGITVHQVESFGKEVDAWDEFLASGRGLTVIRDQKYLDWRYVRCPTTDYRILRAESANGELRGFLVYTLSWHGNHKDIVPLVDWMIEPGDDETWKALLAAVAADARDASLSTPLNTLVAWAPPLHADADTLGRLHFQRLDSPFNLCIMIFTDSFHVQTAVDEWYILMGDSDIY